MKKQHLLIVLLLLCSLAIKAQDNEELQQMYEQDQADRQGEIDWPEVSKRDRMRLEKTNLFSKNAKIHTAQDHYNAAMIYQHGHDTIASGKAVKHMKKAVAMDSSINKWLLAAAIDRDLMRKNKPQIYGTQYVQMGSENPYQRYTLDSTKISDAQRKAYGVRTLAEQQENLKRLNQKKITAKYQEYKHSIEKTIAFIYAQKKQNKGEYDLSEMGINSFGYQLLTKEKNQAALKIFKLNTELYPDAYNTWDSYGEVLLILGKKRDALKAYKKSLQLNPDNQNAKKILSSI